MRNFLTAFSTSQVLKLPVLSKVLKFSTQLYRPYNLRMDVTEKIAFNVTGDEDRW